MGVDWHLIARGRPRGAKEIMRPTTLKRLAWAIALTAIIATAVSLAEKWVALRQSESSSAMHPVRDIPSLAALEPQLVKPLTPEQAVAENAAITLARNAIEQAPAFAGQQLFPD